MWSAGVWISSSVSVRDVGEGQRYMQEDMGVLARGPCLHCCCLHDQGFVSGTKVQMIYWCFCPKPPSAMSAFADPGNGEDIRAPRHTNTPYQTTGPNWHRSWHAGSLSHGRTAQQQIGEEKGSERPRSLPARTQIRENVHICSFRLENDRHEVKFVT